MQTSSIEVFKMKLALFTAVLCCTVLPLALAAQCPSGSIPLRVRGEKLYSSSDQCSDIGSQDSLDALHSRIDEEIESVLPRIEQFLTPSPCAGADWKRVVYIDMTNPNHSCPANSGWQEVTLNEKRLCQRTDPSANKCGKATFDVDDIIGAYTKVCGRVIGYKRGATEGFGEGRTAATPLEEDYVDGVSITHGNPKHHIWTFAAGRASHNQQDNDFVCPCDSSGTPLDLDYIGNRYFCESGGRDLENELLADNALWDGDGCDSNSTCCSFNDPPYFMVTLDDPTCDSIDVRMCASHDDEGTPIELIELYVK